MKKTFSLIALLIAAQVMYGTVRNNTPTTPSVLGTTYYQAANNKKESALFTALSTISGGVTYSYTKLTYDELYTAYKTSDVYPAGHAYAGKIWDMYSTTLFTAGSNECGTYSEEGDCYNREHSMPKSWFGGSDNYKSTNQGCDLGHLVPTDGYVNGRRSNYAFGEVAAATYTSNGGLSKLGSSVASLSVEETTISGTSVSVSNKTVFEPADEYKGDFARIYMYMRTRYASLNLAQADGGIVHFTTTTSAASASKYGWTDYSVILLMKWHRQDPVSQKEIDRNNAMEKMQGNRNPFIDYPVVAEYLWGKHAGETFLLSNAVGSFDEAFVPGVSDGSKEDDVEPLDPEYYAPVIGLKDSLLKSKLAELTWAHYTKRYSYGSGKNNTWDAFWYTDRNESDNSVVDMYSTNMRYFNPDDKTASVADCDIEHMFPNSWFGGESGNKHAYCDLHHLVPADYSANRSKSNRGPGVPTDTTFNNGVWVNGKDAGRDNLEVFCPPDEYKGDFARAFFYIATTYGDTAVWQKEAVPNHMTNSDWHEFLPLTRDLLLEWHRLDPVSEKERVRMSIVYGLQGNRNPFIDYPCLAEYIWGIYQGEVFSLDCSGAPVPVYTITWSVDGKVSSAEVTKGVRPSAPSVEDCSESRVFRGWTTTRTFIGEPEILYTAATIPAASKDMTYYAVYADKEVEEDGGEFTPYSGALTEGDYIIYYNGKAMNTTVSSSRLGYTELSPAGGKISTGDSTIIWHLAPAGDYWTIYNAKEKQYAASTGTKNQARLLDDGADSCSLWTVSGSATYELINLKNTVKEVNANLRNNSTFGFACYSTSTGGALTLYKRRGIVTYSNYSTACSLVIPQYTLTFMNGDEVHDEITGPAGESILVYDPVPPCAGYTFYGWSEATYSSGNTDQPEQLVPAYIPEEDKTYYAVFAKTVETGTTLTNRYRKISTTDELTNANYLVVADTSRLVAMSNEWKNTYYLGSVAVTDSEGIITTEDEKCIWNIQVSGSELSFSNSEAGYLYIEKSTSGNKTYYNIKLGANTEANKFTCSVSNGVWVFSSVSYPDRQIEYYRKNAYWSYYTGQDAPVYLYKQQEAAVSTTYYTTSPDCQGVLPTALEPATATPSARKVLIDNRLCVLIGDHVYDITGRQIR